MKRDILSEGRKLTQMMKGSVFDENQNNWKDNVLGQKVDKNELNILLKEKSNKQDISMAHRQIQILHKQLD